jgi:hypothetical protein
MKDQFVFNGIDGATGGYLLPPMSPEDVSVVARGEVLDPQHLAELQRKNRSAKRRQVSHRPTGKKIRKTGMKAGPRPWCLEESGWGVIFACHADPAIREAMAELLSLRRKQATQKNEHYYKEYFGAKGYRPGESTYEFLARNGMGPGPADPEKVPYYLLIIGDPETIPFSFQYQLDVQYGVGRIHFDTLTEYAQYAPSVVVAETGEVSLPRRAVFFGVENPNDEATARSANSLVSPLAALLKKEMSYWQVETILKSEANKARLGRLLGGDESPALLFTASHGVGFPNGDSRQLKQQGALLCQDWPGPTWQESIPQEFYFAGDDVGEDALLRGMICFHFACYGAGTPQFDSFAQSRPSGRYAIAPRPFLANLPQRLLGHPKGGALAVVGHIDLAWGWSFAWPGAGAQLAAFESVIRMLMYGRPVGMATEYLNQRYAELSSYLSELQDHEQRSNAFDDLKLCELWTARNDARSYIILGDPAVRLAATA